MKIFSFYYLLILIKIISSSDSFKFFERNDSNTIDVCLDTIIENITKQLRLNNSSLLENLSISDTCKRQFNNSFFNKDDYISYYRKLIIDSSLNKNNIYSYYNCINKKYNNSSFKYLTVLVNGDQTIYDVLNTKNINSSSYLIGLCVVDGCRNDEYKKIILKIIEYYTNLNNLKENNINGINNYTIHNNDTKDKDINNINVDKYLVSEIEIYALNDKVDKSKGLIKFFEYLPCIIILIHLFFVIFNKLPLYLYNLGQCIFCCKRENKIPSRESKLSSYSYNLLKKNDKNKLKNQSYNPVNSDRNPSAISSFSNDDNFLKSIYLLFDISKNLSSIIVYKKQSEISNDSGLSFINGIKAISMIFFLFGAVYNALYSSFLVEKEETTFFHHLKNFYFSIFFVGIKYAPKLLLCCSGFSLFFKFICFLDGKVENEEDINRQNIDDTGTEKEKRKGSGSNASNSNTNSFYNQLKKSATQEILNKNNLISLRYLLYFYGKQFHKYIIFILFLTFIFFSLNKIVLFFETLMPIWSFFLEKMVNSVKKFQYLFLPFLIGYKSHLIPAITNKNENILDYLYLVFQEIMYFLFTTLIIFIGYKRNIRIDRIFKIIFIILFIFRIVFYCHKNLDDKNYFGYNNEYGKFYTSILYNYTFYIIGIHFGMINYIIQKGYSFRECSRQNKIYLINSLRVLKTTKRRSKKYLYIISIVCGFILLFNTFLQQIIMIFYNLNKDNIIKKYKANIFTQILMFIDADIFVIALFLMALCLYIKGDNKINNFLCHNFWSIFNRFYFSYILLINPIILYVIYVNETKIIFNISSCFLYCFICGILVFSISIFACVAFELPYKKLIHFWIKLSEKAAINERLSHIENAYNFGLEHNLLDSATASITDFIEEEDEEEDN